jgi:hypothetical protein
MTTIMVRGWLSTGETACGGRNVAMVVAFFGESADTILWWLASSVTTKG